jgi:hypothetical protein
MWNINLVISHLQVSTEVCESSVLFLVKVVFVNVNGYIHQAALSTPNVKCKPAPNLPFESPHPSYLISFHPTPSHAITSSPPPRRIHHLAGIGAVLHLRRPGILPQLVFSTAHLAFVLYRHAAAAEAGVYYICAEGAAELVGVSDAGAEG